MTFTLSAAQADRAAGAMRGLALRDVVRALPHADPNLGFRAALKRLATDAGRR